MCDIEKHIVRSFVSLLAGDQAKRKLVSNCLKLVKFQLLKAIKQVLLPRILISILLHCIRKELPVAGPVGDSPAIRVTEGSRYVFHVRTYI